MDMSLRKRLVSGRLALLVGLGVLGCTIANLVLADASSAAVPPSGLNCVESDGKISGRGATFQKVLVTSVAALYRDDVCGPTGTETTEKGAAGNTMIAYNYPAAENASATGSGAGIKAESCRTDAFAGSDKPYNKAQLAELDGVPGATGGCAIAFEPPFQPKPGPWPNASDIKANMMSMPIGGSSEPFIVHLGAGTCEGKAPTALNFTGKEVSRIMGGDAKEWSDAELVATNPGLSVCKNKIIRVVRQDDSGTTNIMKLFLARADPARTGAVCGVVAGPKTLLWPEYDTTPNNIWPGTKEKEKEGECTEVVPGASSGNPALLKKLSETEAGAGYADLGDVVTNTEINKPGVVFAHIQNATGTEFVAANTGKGANCDYRTLSLPGTNAESAVGLNPEDNWATDNKEGNRGNATDLGSKYPICGLTFDFVYTGLDNGAVANANSRLTADQRRTLYSFFTFLYSSTAQESYNQFEYAALPVSWVGQIREGFQANF